MILGRNVTSPRRGKETSDSTRSGCRSLRVRNTGRNPQLNLRPRISFAPNIDLAAEALAALAHPRKSPVAGALTKCEDLRFHTYSIVANADSEICITKGDFGFDLPGHCMLVTVPDRFACDPISLIANDGSQVARPALDDDSVLRF